MGNQTTKSLPELYLSNELPFRLLLLKLNHSTSINQRLCDRRDEKNQPVPLNPDQIPFSNDTITILAAKHGDLHRLATFLTLGGSTTYSTTLSRNAYLWSLAKMRDVCSLYLYSSFFEMRSLQYFPQGLNLAVKNHLYFFVWFLLVQRHAYKKPPFIDMTRNDCFGEFEKNLQNEGQSNSQSRPQTPKPAPNGLDTHEIGTYPLLKGANATDNRQIIDFGRIFDPERNSFPTNGALNGENTSSQPGGVYFDYYQRLVSHNYPHSSTSPHHSATFINIHDNNHDFDHNDDSSLTTQHSTTPNHLAPKQTPPNNLKKQHFHPNSSDPPPDPFPVQTSTQHSHSILSAQPRNTSLSNTFNRTQLFTFMAIFSCLSNAASNCFQKTPLLFNSIGLPGSIYITKPRFCSSTLVGNYNRGLLHSCKPESQVYTSSNEFKNAADKLNWNFRLFWLSLYTYLDQNFIHKSSLPSPSLHTPYSPLLTALRTPKLDQSPSEMTFQKLPPPALISLCIINTRLCSRHVVLNNQYVKKESNQEDEKKHSFESETIFNKVNSPTHNTHQHFSFCTCYINKVSILEDQDTKNDNKITSKEYCYFYPPPLSIPSVPLNQLQYLNPYHPFNIFNSEEKKGNSESFNHLGDFFREHYGEMKAVDNVLPSSTSQNNLDGLSVEQKYELNFLETMLMKNSTTAPRVAGSAHDIMVISNDAHLSQMGIDYWGYTDSPNQVNDNVVASHCNDPKSQDLLFNIKNLNMSSYLSLLAPFNNQRSISQSIDYDHSLVQIVGRERLVSAKKQNALKDNSKSSSRSAQMSQKIQPTIPQQNKKKNGYLVELSKKVRPALGETGSEVHNRPKYNIIQSHAAHIALGIDGDAFIIHHDDEKEGIYQNDLAYGNHSLSNFFPDSELPILSQFPSQTPHPCSTNLPSTSSLPFSSINYPQLISNGFVKYLDQITTALPLTPLTTILYHPNLRSFISNLYTPFSYAHYPLHTIFHKSPPKMYNPQANSEGNLINGYIKKDKNNLECMDQIGIEQEKRSNVDEFFEGLIVKQVFEEYYKHSMSIHGSLYTTVHHNDLGSLSITSPHYSYSSPNRPTTQNSTSISSSKISSEPHSSLVQPNVTMTTIDLHIKEPSVIYLVASLHRLLQYKYPHMMILYEWYQLTTQMSNFLALVSQYRLNMWMLKYGINFLVEFSKQISIQLKNYQNSLQTLQNVQNSPKLSDLSPKLHPSFDGFDIDDFLASPNPEMATPPTNEKEQHEDNLYQQKLASHIAYLENYLISLNNYIITRQTTLTKFIDYKHIPNSLLNRLVGNISSLFGFDMTLFAIPNDASPIPSIQHPQYHPYGPCGDPIAGLSKCAESGGISEQNLSIFAPNQSQNYNNRTFSNQNPNTLFKTNQTSSNFPLPASSQVLQKPGKDGSKDVNSLTKSHNSPTNIPLVLTPQWCEAVLTNKFVTCGEEQRLMVESWKHVKELTDEQIISSEHMMNDINAGDHEEVILEDNNPYPNDQDLELASKRDEANKINKMKQFYQNQINNYSKMHSLLQKTLYDCYYSHIITSINRFIAKTSKLLEDITFYIQSPTDYVNRYAPTVEDQIKSPQNGTNNINSPQRSQPSPYFFAHLAQIVPPEIPDLNTSSEILTKLLQQSVDIRQWLVMQQPYDQETSQQPTFEHEEFGISFEETLNGMLFHQQLFSQNAFFPSQHIQQIAQSVNLNLSQPQQPNSQNDSSNLSPDPFLPTTSPPSLPLPSPHHFPPNPSLITPQNRQTDHLTRVLCKKPHNPTTPSNQSNPSLVLFAVAPTHQNNNGYRDNGSDLQVSTDQLTLSTAALALSASEEGEINEYSIVGDLPDLPDDLPIGINEDIRNSISLTTTASGYKMRRIPQSELQKITQDVLNKYLADEYQRLQAYRASYIDLTFTTLYYNANSSLYNTKIDPNYFPKFFEKDYFAQFLPKKMLFFVSFCQKTLKRHYNQEKLKFCHNNVDIFPTNGNSNCNSLLIHQIRPRRGVLFEPKRINSAQNIVNKPSGEVNPKNKDDKKENKDKEGKSVLKNMREIGWNGMMGKKAQFKPLNSIRIADHDDHDSQNDGYVDYTPEIGNGGEVEGKIGQKQPKNSDNGNENENVNHSKSLPQIPQNNRFNHNVSNTHPFLPQYDPFMPLSFTIYEAEEEIDLIGKSLQLARIDSDAYRQECLQQESFMKTFEQKQNTNHPLSASRIPPITPTPLPLPSSSVPLQQHPNSPLNLTSSSGQTPTQNPPKKEKLGFFASLTSKFTSTKPTPVQPAGDMVSLPPASPSPLSTTNSTTLQFPSPMASPTNSYSQGSDRSSQLNIPEQYEKRQIKQKGPMNQESVVINSFFTQAVQPNVEGFGAIHWGDNVGDGNGTKQMTPLSDDDASCGDRGRDQQSDKNGNSIPTHSQSAATPTFTPLPRPVFHFGLASMAFSAHPDPPDPFDVERTMLDQKTSQLFTEINPNVVHGSEYDDILLNVMEDVYLIEKMF